MGNAGANGFEGNPSRTWGEWTFISADDQGSPQESHGKYVFVWKQVDGSWKVAVNMWNDNPEG